jgi:hypothetical protein
MDLSPAGHNQCLGAHIGKEFVLRIAGVHFVIYFASGGPIFHPKGPSVQSTLDYCLYTTRDAQSVISVTP